MDRVKISIITSLYRSEKYLQSFLNHYKRIVNIEQCELILIHNDPTTIEQRIIDDYKRIIPNLMVLNVERESLYSSWNRGVKFANGEYLTIWNVDDVRQPDSLYNQAVALDCDNEAVLVYGNFIMVDTYGSKIGQSIKEVEFKLNANSFLRRFHISCFPMWRKEIHEVIGYFDEQFKLVADFDFQIRVAKKFKLAKVNKNLGFYLRGTPSNLSSNYKLQDTELTALHLRYGNYDLLNLTRLPAALKLIKIKKFKWFNAYHKCELYLLKEKLLDIGRTLKIVFSLINFPKHFLRYIKRYSLFTRLLKKINN